MNENFECEFLFSENFFGKPECLVCHRTLSRCAKYDMERHFITCHSEYNNVSNDERKLLIIELKKTFYEKFIADSEEFKEEECTKYFLKKKTSYVIAAGLAKRSRPYEDGQFYKDLSNDVLKCFGEKANEIRKLINDVPLSPRTIIRRTENISAFIYSNIKNKILNSRYFSICLDECTDINNIAQLIICVKTVDESFKTHEEILRMVALHGNVKGSTIFNIVYEEVFSFADKAKFSSVCTDGANVMVGKKDGFVGFLLKNSFDVYTFHCIIHQQALFTKCLNITNTMDIVLKIINKIRGGHNALSHRKFKTFLEEVNAEYGDLQMYTEVRWLSKGRCLQRLFSLREEVALFFEQNPSNETSQFITFLKDPNFLLDFAFLTDLTEFVNQLNLQLQGKNKTIIELVFAVHQFIRKIELIIMHLKEKNLINLTRTSEVFNIFPYNMDKLNEYVNILETLLVNYDMRFKDFNKIENIIELHNNPLLCNIEKQSAAVKEEILKMRNDLNLPLTTGIEFWKNINEASYPKSKNEIFKLYSMFGSTYICESSFSTLKLIKDKNRNRLTDVHVEDLVRIKCCPYDIDIDSVIQHEP